MAYATANDVQARLGRQLTDEETPMVGARLEDVERMIRRRIPDLDEKVTEGVIDEEDVIQVESDAVLRVVRNPDGVYSETDGTYSYSLRRDVASGSLEITTSEWAALGAGSAFGVINLSPRTPFEQRSYPTNIHPFYLGL